jgi:hypothetical protein
MKRIPHTILLASLLCLVVLVHSTVRAQTQYVRGVPQCGHSEYDNSGNWYLIDTCNIDVTITFTNSGNGAAWGQAHIGAGQRELTETMGNANPRDNGTISLFTCPGTSTAVTPDGRQFGNHYHGEYTCQQN